jgi:hypothetical protein
MRVLADWFGELAGIRYMLRERSREPFSAHP